MKTKFELCVFVETEKNTFSEFKTLEELLEEYGEEYRKNITGYFPPRTNITYEELKKITEEKNWTVAYHKSTDNPSYSYHELVSFYSTLDLKRNLPNLLEQVYDGDDYLMIYQNEDFVYLQEKTNS